MYRRLITSFALFTPNVGEQNQIRGLAVWLAKLGRKNKKFGTVLNFDIFAPNISGGSLRLSDYSDYSSFEKDVNMCLDAYFAAHLWTPRIFITSFTQGEKENAARNSDALCKAVKDYYLRNRKGEVVTVVVTAGVYDYAAADIVNIPEHMISDGDCRLIAGNTEKFFVSTGIIHNMTKTFIRQKFWQKRLRRALSDMSDDAPTVVFCLGGRSNGNDIVFGLAEAEKIWHKIRRLTDRGYKAIIVNMHRTPNDVTDYFYEQSLQCSDVRFFNSKKIAEKDEERTLENWRVYYGPHEDEFRRQMAKYGNVYPGVLGRKNVIAVHTFDSFASCETASSGIPTAICRDVKINAATRPDCYRLADELISRKYAIDFDDFDGSVMPDSLNLKPLPMVNKVFARKVMDFYFRQKMSFLLDS